MHIAQVVERYEPRASEGEEEERKWVGGQGDGREERAKAAELGAGVPAAECEGDETRWLEEARRGGGGLDRGNGLREDGEDEHGYREGCCDGESEVAEFEEEGCEGNGLLGVRGGVLF